METARTLRTGQKNGHLLASTRIYLVAPERGGGGLKAEKAGLLGAMLVHGGGVQLIQHKCCDPPVCVLAHLLL